MKIIIVGAGISGLSTYLHLRKHLSLAHHTITIYESHRPRSGISTSASDQDLSLDALSASTAIVGGGLGISANGMRVLRELDPNIHDAVAAQGFPAEHFIFKGANGWTLGMQTTSDKKVRNDGDEEEVCVASSRHGLWQTLMKSVDPSVVKYRKVVSVEKDKDSGTVFVKLVDEHGNLEHEKADLIIGADGVKSVVRMALFRDDEHVQPKYLGQSGVGGFFNQAIPDIISKNRAMLFTFGGNGFFGYSSGAPEGDKSIMWWSTYETSSLPDSAALDRAAIKEALIKRHQHWNDPIIQDIIQNAEIQSIYPTWVLPELPHWGEDGLVLVGDAAHAVDPTTGQGASQALEDSQTLALLLAECLKRGENGKMSIREAIPLTIRLFYQIRSPRVHEIIERGKKLAGSKANVGTIKEYMMYCFLWLMMKLPALAKLMLGDVNRSLYTWSAREEIQAAFQKYDAA